MNPLGLFEEFRFGYRGRIFESQDSFSRSNYTALSAIGTLTPAWGRIGGLFEFAPLSILQFSVQYEFVGYFRTFGLFQSFQSPNANFSDGEISRLGNGDGRTNYITSGAILTLGALFQIKFDPVIIRSNFRAFYYAMNTRLDPMNNRFDTVHYDQLLDVLAPARGWVVTNDADLLVQTPWRLLIGVRYTVTQPFYPDDAYAAGEAKMHNNGPLQRIGPLISWTIAERRHGAFNGPTISILAQWWITHRYRTDPMVAAIPLFGLAFTFRGDP